MAERKFNTDQSRTENTLSTNRQSDLEMEYKDDFRDGARVDAIDKIEARLTKQQKRGKISISYQLKAYRLACLIFEVKKTRKHMKGPLKSQEFIHIFPQPPFRFSFLQGGHPSNHENSYRRPNVAHVQCLLWYGWKISYSLSFLAQN